MAGFMFCDVKLKAPNDKAAASVLEVEEDEEVEVMGTPPVRLAEEAFRLGCRFNWRAFASAFS